MDTPDTPPAEPLQKTSRATGVAEKVRNVVIILAAPVAAMIFVGQKLMMGKRYKVTEGNGGGGEEAACHSHAPVNRKAILAIAAMLCGAALNMRSAAEPPKGKPAAGSKDVTAAQVNGTWRCRKNTIKVWALGGGKLQVDVDCVFEYKSPAYGPMANLGQAAGTAKIEGDTAVFIPTEDEKDGKITMRFSGGKMIVEQTGTCGFGHRVYATGTYEKVSAKKPKFGE